jgi:hypothetical protein
LVHYKIKIKLLGNFGASASIFNQVSLWIGILGIGYDLLQIIEKAIISANSFSNLPSI